MSQVPPPLPNSQCGAPAPIWVEPLGRSTPRPRRPGWLTAVGIVSIVLASLGILGSLGSAFYAVVFYSISRTMATVAATPLPAPSRAAPLQTSVSPAINGLAPAPRSVVLAGLLSAHPLSAPRRDMLDRLLAEGGKDILAFSESNVTAQRVTAGVTDSGRLPGVGGKTGNDYYVLGTGRIEIADSHAVFRPDGGGEVVRVYAGEIAAESTGDEVEPAVAGGAGVPATASTAYAAAPRPVFFSFSGNALAMVLVNSVLGLLLAGFLLVAGIMVLRDSRHGRRMHLFYAAIKIPLAMFSAVAWGLAGFDLTLAAGAAAGAPAPAGGLIAMGVIIACIGFAYPVALILALNTRGAQDYYALTADG